VKRPLTSKQDLISALGQDFDRVAPNQQKSDPLQSFEFIRQKPSVQSRCTARTTANVQTPIVRPTHNVGKVWKFFLNRRRDWLSTVF